MTIAELREIIQDLDDDVEVRIASQPRWPLEYSIASPAAFVESDEEEDEEGDTQRCPLKDAPPEGVLYLGEGRQIGYLPTPARRGLRWGRD